MKTAFRKRWYLFVPLIFGAIVGFGAVTMWLWNALMPIIFHLPVITFWQAAGLLILMRLLFGGMGHHGRHHQWRHDLRDKWATMTPEEREQFRKNMHQHRPPWFGHSCCNENEVKTETPNS